MILSNFLLCLLPSLFPSHLLKCTPFRDSHSLHGLLLTLMPSCFSSVTSGLERVVFSSISTPSLATHTSAQCTLASRSQWILVSKSLSHLTSLHQLAVDCSILFHSSSAPLAFPTTVISWVFLIPFTDVAFVPSLFISSVSALFSPSDDLWQRPVHKHEFPSENLKSTSLAQTPLLSFNSDSYFQSPPVNPQRCTVSKRNWSFS